MKLKDVHHMIVGVVQLSKSTDPTGGRAAPMVSGGDRSSTTTRGELWGRARAGLDLVYLSNEGGLLCLGSKETRKFLDNRGGS